MTRTARTVTSKPSTPSRLTVNRTVLARLMGVHPDRITKWVKDGLPVLKAGGRGKESEFDAVAALAWERSRRPTSITEAEKTRYTKGLADRVEQDVRRRAGELVDASDVEKRNAARTIAARERLLQLPGTAVQRGVPAQFEDMLIELVDQTLLELAAKGGYVHP